MEQHQILHSTLKRLLLAKNRKPGTSVPTTQQTLIMICEVAKENFLNGSVPTLLQLTPPINVVGDIHGQFYDLLRIFGAIGLPPDQKYLFLGDYVDRGSQCIETISLLLILKILYPDNIYLLRGNHEISEINSIEGFKAECDSRYSTRLWTVFNEVFDAMPLAAIIGNKIFASHAGISPHLLSNDISIIKTIPRPLKKPEGLALDLMWSDPDPQANGFIPNPRGVSYLFGPTEAQTFLDKNQFDVIVRSHQSAAGGFEFPFDPDRCILTIYSAPYSGVEGQSSGAVMTVGTDLCCSFTTINPLERKTSTNQVSELEAILKGK